MRSFILSLLLLASIIGNAGYAAEHGEGEGGNEKSSEAMGQYLEIKPAIIVNYGGPGPVHFLKVEMTLRLSKDAEANLLTMRHMPHIRHELIMLFSRQTEDSLSTMPGKEQLRVDALAAVQKVLESEENKKLVDDLLFTNFVIQR